MELLFLFLFHLNAGNIFQQILKNCPTLPSTINLQSCTFKHSVLLFCIHETCLNVYSMFIFSMLCYPFIILLFMYVIAELQRAKRASEAPWVRKIGNPSSQENLVMTSAYEQASEHPYRLGGRGRGISRYSSWNAIFPSWRFWFRKVRKTLISICHVNRRSECLI